MKYILIAMVLISIFFLRPVSAEADCTITLRNCLSENFNWCSFDGDSFWDTIYSYTGGQLSSDTSITTTGCDTNSSCYVYGEETTSSFGDGCLELDVDGFVDCDEYACVDGDVSWHSGDSEYSCSDNTCTTD